MPAASTPPTNPSTTNPLLADWAGPYGGTPAFDKMRVDDLEPALRGAIKRHLAELDDIAQNPDPPTFENTIVAMDASGEMLDRVSTYYGIWSSNLATPDFRAIEEQIAALFSEYETQIIQNTALFARIEAIYKSDELKQRSPAEQRLVSLTYDRFARQGAMLTGDAKARYAAIQRRLAELYTAFGNHVLTDEENYVVYLKGDQLGGLPQSFRDAAAAAATERGRTGEFAITNTRSSMDPFLTYSTERSLREKVWNNYYNRGDNGDDNDNNAVIAEILKLRDERVALLGYDNFAQWRLENRMAKTPERAMQLMMDVWPSAVARVHEEVADMQAIADAEGAEITIEPWDYRFYAEKVRQQKYALDSSEVKQYLQLDKLREAMFMVAGELFHFEFTPLPQGAVPVYHKDVTVWEVKRKDTGDLVGLWYLDPYARTGKRSGAWATTYRAHSTAHGPCNVLAANNSNFIPGQPDEPVLVSWDDATTLFHEFGHALHYLSSNVPYRGLGGGVRDYTEFQSQLLERWVLTDRVIKTYLVHYETGEPMPDELITKIRAASTFNQGFSTTEYLASAIIDLKLHMIDPAGLDPDVFEREELAKLDMPPQLVMRHRTPHFGHVFAGEGYAAGYYGYLWADVLTSDAAEAFAEAPGGFYDPEVSSALVEHLFAVQNAVDPADAYRAFRGRDATIDALMRDRGFPVPTP